MDNLEISGRGNELKDWRGEINWEHKVRSGKGLKGFGGVGGQ